VECRPMRRVDVALSRMSVDGSKERMVGDDALAESRVVVVLVDDDEENDDDEEEEEEEDTNDDLALMKDDDGCAGDVEK
jgi:hypothetical protein